MSNVDKGTRQNYLDRQWERYPDACDLKISGRIVSIDRSYLNLWGGSPSTIKKRKRCLVKSIENWNQLKDILLPGDIVGLKKNGHCVLLAPNRAENFEASAISSWSTAIAGKMDQQQKWNLFIKYVRSFFESRKFLSVNTPSLVLNPGPEPSIDVFKTEYKNGKNKTDKYLITSPELHLKTILSQTLAPIYEITKVFRNNEHSSKHQPEFWMIEWYRPFATLQDIANDVQDLILFLVENLSPSARKIRFQHTSFRKVLKDNYKIDFLPESTEQDLKLWLKQNKIYYSESLNQEDLFSLLNLELVETKLNKSNIVFLNDYPPYAAALAKINPSGWAQRFEVYWQDLELGNAFNELNDPEQQYQRFTEDNIKKSKNGLEPLPIDKNFLETLRLGMPPAAGISMGLERLFMAINKEFEIGNLRWFNMDE